MSASAAAALIIIGLWILAANIILITLLARRPHRRAHTFDTLFHEEPETGHWPDAGGAPDPGARKGRHL